MFIHVNNEGEIMKVYLFLILSVITTQSIASKLECAWEYDSTSLLRRNLEDSLFKPKYIDHDVKMIPNVTMVENCPLFIKRLYEDKNFATAVLKEGYKGLCKYQKSGSQHGFGHGSALFCRMRD